MRRSSRRIGGLLLAAALVAGCHGPARTTSAATTAAATTSAPTGGVSGPVPPGVVARPDHVVVVIEENRGYAEVIGRPEAPYLNGLAAQGALFDHSFAVAHPSQPNYLALFSGSTQGVVNDSCPHTLTGPNLASQLIGAGLSFAAYSEDLPAPGSAVCGAGGYARKHAPWVNFPSVPAGDNLAFTAFPADVAALPTVAFVVPDLRHDMHDGTVGEADRWLRDHLDGYARWAREHASLLVITWDEDDGSAANHIPTIVTGARVRPGLRTEQITHYSVLRTLEDMFGLPALGAAATAAPITDLLH